MLPPGQGHMYVFLDSMEAIVETEYLLMDASALLSSIGGFAGMLLGWSAKDAARIVTNAWEKYRKDK